MSREFKPKKFSSFAKPIDINYFGLPITIDNMMFDGTKPKYITTDKDDSLYVHSHKPYICENYPCWLSDGDNETIGKMVFKGDWKNSLAKIKDIKIKK